MAGGQRIDDRKSWVGAPAKGTVFPTGAKTKEESSAQGAGSVGKYEDTTEAIKGVQMQGEGKIRGHKMKDGYRY